MKNTRNNLLSSLALMIAGLIFSTGALAEKPDWVDSGKQGKYKQNKKQERSEKSSHSSKERQDRGERRDRHFGDEQRTVINHYYTEQYRVGRCPPGLAKKHNGCMPPGQVRHWVVGRPLPREVIYYDLPASVVVQLGMPRAGQRYVRVASDILLIAIGTGMVLDGIENLGR